MANDSHNKSVRLIIFQEDYIWYGVAIEFDISIVGQSMREVKVFLHEAIDAHVEQAKEQNAHEMFDQEPNPEYQLLWHLLQTKQQIPGHYKVEYFGTYLI